jgi:glycosyltransferase involved in cell wall biosynthesis
LNGSRPRTLLFLNPTGVHVWGGVETWMLTVADGLHARGHAVFAAGRAGGRFLERFAAHGFETLGIGGRNDFSPRDIFRLRRQLRRQGVDAIITKLNRGIRLAGMAAGLAGGRRTVIAHMGLMEAKPGWRSALAYRCLLHGVNVPCRAIAEQLIHERGFPPDKVTIVSYGIDPERFRPDAEEREAFRSGLGLGESPVAGIVARLDDQKGHADFLEALRMLPDMQALIVGGGPLESALRDRARALGLAGRVRFLGHRDDVLNVLRGIDLLVLSSHSEGLPFVVLEAMGVGLPVVATRVGGLAEVVRDGETGYLVPPGRPDALAAAVQRILDRPDLASGMGRAGRALVLREYGQRRMVDHVERMIGEFVRRRRGEPDGG